MLKLRQYLCRHKEFNMIAKHNTSNQNLWQCARCQVFCIQHWGIGMYYYSKTPHIKGWKYDVKEW